MKTRSLLRPRVGAVLALVDAVHRGHVESVHDFRVAARSLRAALRTLARRPGSSRARRTKKSLRRAIRLLADVRDRDVGRSLLTRLAQRSSFEPSLRRRIHGLSDSDRRKGLLHCQTQWPKTLDRELIALLGKREPGVKTVIRRARAEAWQKRRRAIVMLTALGRTYSPVRLHELRRRIRGLRYAIEVLAEVESSAGPRVIQLKPLQDALGDAQDRIVLSRWLSSHAGRFRRTDRSLSKELQGLSRHFRAESVRAHASFLRLRPRAILEGLALHVDPRTD